MSETTWTQQVFDETLIAYLKEHDSGVWPKTLNKKAARITWRALKETPAKEREGIAAELSREINAKREDGSSGTVPIGFVIASKRASKGWTQSPQFRRVQNVRLKGRDASELKAWLSLVRNKFRSMLGGRKAASGFLKVGWISVLRAMAAQGVPEARTSGTGAKIRGSLKGGVVVAKPGSLNVTMENTAHALTEKKVAFMRIGEPALQRAFDAETADMEEYLYREMHPHAEEWNRKQH